MYLLGHIGFTIFLGYIVQRSIGIEPMKHKLIIGFGAMFPDFIDKPIGSIFFGRGRWFGHSLVFQSLLLIIILALIATYNLDDKVEYPLQKFAMLVYLGTIAHMILDQPGLGREVILWPFYGPIPEGNREDFLLSATNPRVIVTELAGLLLMIFIGIRDNWNSKEWKVLTMVTVSYLVLLYSFYLILV